MKARTLLPLLLLIGLPSCQSPSTHDPLLDGMVGVWQYRYQDVFLGHTDNLIFHENGRFELLTTDKIVGFGMKGSWRVEDGRVLLVPTDITSRGEPVSLPTEFREGFLSEPIDAKRHVVRFDWHRDNGGKPDEYSRIGTGADIEYWEKEHVNRLK